MHIASAADCRSISELIGGRLDRLFHLFAAMTRAPRWRGARKSFEHMRRRQQRAKILERNLFVRDVAQESIDLARGDSTQFVNLGAILEEAPAG